MPPSLDGLALGLIETRGYVGVIAATDAAVKAGNVEVKSVERASGGLVLVAVVGDVASVQVAVQAGAERAASVGYLVSSHVIPRPDESVWRILNVMPDRSAHVSSEADRSARAKADDLDSLPVRELRRKARATESIALTGRRISSASRDELLKAIREARAASDE